VLNLRRCITKLNVSLRSKSIEKKTNKTSAMSLYARMPKEKNLVTKISNKKTFGGTIDIDAKKVAALGIRTSGF